ncbi:MAG: DUF3025 domain-containing protein [Burkholderiaceae bacterium]
MTTSALPALDEIDWSRPWLAPWRACGERLAGRAADCGLVEALNAIVDVDMRSRAGPLRFVAQSGLPPGEPYEAFIARTGCVPTRANLHDFFNGLAWLVHPGLKRRLNELQAQQIADAAPGAPRGAVRDALTLFDENAALLQAPEALLEALRRRDWHTLFVTGKALWAEAELHLFGHALLEKLVRPRKAITAHVWVLPQAPGGRRRAWDDVADTLDVRVLAARPFLPLPVLGVPGWWPENQDRAFYRDPTVFRASR